jgi:transposase
MADPNSVPDEIDALRAALSTEQQLRREAEARAAGGEAIVAHLKLMIARLRHDRFARSSERGRKLLDQLELELEEAAAAEDASSADNHHSSRSLKRRRRLIRRMDSVNPEQPQKKAIGCRGIRFWQFLPVLERGSSLAAPSPQPFRPTPR